MTHEMQGREGDQLQFKETLSLSSWKRRDRIATDGDVGVLYEFSRLRRSMCTSDFK